MSTLIDIEVVVQKRSVNRVDTIEIPLALTQFHLPDAVQARLQCLLDRQDQGQGLPPLERSEAEGLVELAEFLSLLKLRSTQVVQQG